MRDMSGLPTLTYQLPYSMVPPAMRRLWAAEYGGAQVYTQLEVQQAMAAQKVHTQPCGVMGRYIAGA